MTHYVAERSSPRQSTLTRMYEKKLQNLDCEWFKDILEKESKPLNHQKHGGCGLFLSLNAQTFISPDSLVSNFQQLSQCFPFVRLLFRLFY
jgi:hypothetical protein